MLECLIALQIMRTNRGFKKRTWSGSCNKMSKGGQKSNLPTHWTEGAAGRWQHGCVAIKQRSNHPRQRVMNASREGRPHLPAQWPTTDLEMKGGCRCANERALSREASSQECRQRDSMWPGGHGGSRRILCSNPQSEIHIG